MGSTKKKTTQTYRPPSWVTAGSQKAIGIGSRIADQAYTPYTGDRVAALSQNEQMGMELARESTGMFKPYADRAGALLERGSQQFTDANMQDYMNPYIKGALDPAARELRQYGALQQRGISDRAASTDALGRRSHLAKADVEEKTMQSLSDLYGKGYADAYQFAASMWGADRARDMEAAGRFQQLGKDAQSAAEADVSTLMATGLVDRNIQQAMMDFDYRQFIENRDWDIRGLSSLLASIQGTQGSYNTTQTTEEKTSSGAAGVLGSVSQLVGLALMFSNPITGAIGGALGAAGGATAAAGATGGASLASGALAASDRRLKQDIRLIGRRNGVNLYSWTWNMVARRFGLKGPATGVIAQENPQHSAIGPNGYLMVNYATVFGG